MNKIKIIVTMALTLIIVALLLIGCSGDNEAGNADGTDNQNAQMSNDEKKIMADLEAYGNIDLSGTSGEIVSLKIEKRQTDKDAGVDTVWCTARTENTQYSYEKKLTLKYNLYDVGGWILDNVSVNDRSDWIIEPIGGASEEDIINSLNGITITADNEYWGFADNNIKNLVIDKQETDLETRIDVVTVTLTIDDEVEEAVGQLVLTYKFNRQWELDTVSGNDSFTASTKPGAALNITTEMLIDTLSEQTFEYGVGETQNITVTKNAISDFIIESQEFSDRGRTAKYLCSFTLTKPHAEFAVEATVLYSYRGEWTQALDSVTAKCTSVELSGVWTGTMYSKACELNITDSSADGAISGIFTYYDGEGSYYVSGKIDLNTLIINLAAGDEIKVGVNSFGNAYGTSDIDARLSVDDSAISGNARKSFTVTK